MDIGNKGRGCVAREGTAVGRRSKRRRSGNCSRNLQRIHRGNIVDDGARNDNSASSSSNNSIKTTTTWLCYCCFFFILCCTLIVVLSCRCPFAVVVAPLPPWAIKAMAAFFLCLRKFPTRMPHVSRSLTFCVACHVVSRKLGVVATESCKLKVDFAVLHALSSRPQRLL